MKRAIREKLKLLEQNDRDTANCIFCGASPTTEEHVFSRWTHKYMLPRPSGKAKSRVAVQHVDRLASAELKLPGAIRDWQVRCVCRPCNNNWMSRLDTEAQPIMRPLILGQSTRLFEKECSTIAAWAVLKSMIVHHKLVHHMRRKSFKRLRVPPKDWAVWIANYQRGSWEGEWLSWPCSVREGAEQRPHRPSAYNAHISIQIIKSLYIHVTNLPYEDFATKWRFRRPGGSLLAADIIRIWPYNGASIVWPPRALDDDDAMIASEAVFRRLMRNDAAVRERVKSGLPLR